MKNSRVIEYLAALILFCSGLPLAADDRVRAELRGYQMILDLDLANLSKEIKYTVDRRSTFASGFDRIAYMVELHKSGENRQWVCVTMDAFTTDIMKIGIPTQKSRAVFRQRVTGLNAISNVKTLKQGRVEAGGNVEFWPNRYGPHNGSDMSGRLFPVRARSTSAGSLGGYVDATVDSVRGCFAHDR